MGELRAGVSDETIARWREEGLMPGGSRVVVAKDELARLRAVEEAARDLQQQLDDMAEGLDHYTWLVGSRNALRSALSEPATEGSGS